MRRVSLRVVAALALLTGVGAGRAEGRTDPVGALERTAARLQRTRFAKRELTAVAKPGLVITVSGGVIVASQGIFRERAYLPCGHDKTLNPGDRAELSRLIARQAPGTSGRDLLRSLHQSLRAERALDRRLDPVIDGFLETTPTASERLVWRGSRGSLVLRDGLLVGYRGLSQTGFPVSGTAGRGLTISDGDRERLRKFLRGAE